MNIPLYKKIQNELKLQIQSGIYQKDDYLPSENDLCLKYKITRTTARKALDELFKEGFIERQHGKGSRVKERRKSLGLLNVKGFSDAVGQNVHTTILQKPAYRNWMEKFPFAVSKIELNSPCLHFERIRSVGTEPVMVENNWFSSLELPGFTKHKFVQNSFFKTLSQNYYIEIIGSEQELRAIAADQKISELLNVEVGSPVLQIFIHFATSKKHLNIYAELICNTSKYSVENKYNI
ncbi:MAG: GntR family transcriptional regulator [Bacteroidales bacterium]